MRILLDECVPWPLARLLVGHECTTPQRHGWAGIENGALLRLAENEFDLFITSDQSIRYQQNLQGRRIAILQLSTNKLRTIQNFFELIAAAVATIQPGEYRELVIPQVH